MADHDHGSGPAPAAGDDDARLAAEREAMVSTQVAARGVLNPAVLAAMRAVPRHEFVPDALRASAYADRPLDIGHGQTISQPFIVALMSALSRPSRSEIALEVGTGCGYQAAVLSRLVRHVHTVEINPELHRDAAARLARLGFHNVTAARADGRSGWPAAAPYDIILVTAAPDALPPAIVEQLAPGGRLVIPVGPRSRQQLELVEKNADGLVTSRAVAPVVFVPLVAGGE